MKIRKLVGSPSGPISPSRPTVRRIVFASNSYTEFRESDGRITVQKHRGGNRQVTQVGASDIASANGVLS